jgi:DNA polymerase-3 subunit alpha
MTNFIDLHAHSTFSSAMTAGDAYGTPQQMVDRAVELGWSAVALTDHGWLGGAPALYKAAKKAGIKPIIGCEMYVTPDYLHGVRGKDADGHTFHLTVLALSKEGYENLVVWTTEAMLRDNYHRKPRISLFRMAEIAPNGLHHNVVLSGCLASELNRLLAESNGAGVAAGIEYVRQMKSLFPNFYIEVVDHALPKFENDSFPAYLQMLEREAAVREGLLLLAEITNTPLVVTNDSHMQKSGDRRAHIALKASGWRSRDDDHMGKSSESLIAKYLPDYTYFGHFMRDMEKVVARDNGIPRSALENVADIVGEANICLEPIDNFTYSIPPSGRDDPVDAIRRRISKRLRALSKQHGDVARVRVEHELKSMAGFADYLLLMSDFIKEAKRQGILTWTRGSAANSLLCYCLEIHEIDSIEYGLIFSRFFNPARKKLPDIDLDIDPERYEDFMRIVQEKMEPLVGKGQIVQISNWGTAANRRAFRMAAGALGMPKEEQDEIAKLLPQMIDSGMADEDTDEFMALREDYPELYEIASQVFDSITSVSQHACAWVFGTPERPVAEWVPLYLIASSGTLVTQYDFKTLEDFGLTKMDFLRLKTLAIVSKTMRMIGKSPLDFHTEIPLDDEDTFEMIGEGQVEGVHTLQGKETRQGVTVMKPESVHDIILAAALYRPANTREDKDKLYMERRRGGEVVDYPHEILEDVLGPTKGLSIFQEQAMEICYAAGLDDAFVDDVYQAIKKAKGAGRGAKEAFAALEGDFIKRARKFLGISRGVAEALWETVQSFQGYGFNKGHATSYGLLGYKVAYLKCHHPAEFFAALLDVFPERSAYLAAARGEGYKFLPPDVNKSAAGFGIDKLQDNAIRVGISKVFRIGPTGTREVLRGKPFTDFDDFKERTSRTALKSTGIENLQKVGALESLGLERDRENEDAIQFHVLGFTLKKPGAFRGCKPKHVAERVSSSGWRHLGRTKGLELTSGRASVSKLFWLPPYSEIEERTKEGKKKQSYLELKASPWANVKTWLLTAVDENGVPFHLMVNEDKEYEARLLKFLYEKCQGCVVSLDGMIRLPFVQSGPQGFRVFGVTGAYEADPQIWHLPAKREKKYKLAIAALDEVKRKARHRAS